MYSKLNLKDISDKDYEHAQNVFKKYRNNMGDYHDLYVQTDMLLLCLKILEICALKYMILTHHIFIQHLD